jgi:DNA polymerase III subunit epsilon
VRKTSLALVLQGVGAIVLLAVGVPVVVWLHQRDRARRSVVAFYDVEDEHARWFSELVETFEGLLSMSKAWRLNAAGEVQSTYQYKVNSGANEIVKRVNAPRTLAGPKLLATNIALPTLQAGRQALHFLPDRLLIRDGNRFSDLDYGSLQAVSRSQRFIENQSVPRDGQQVDTTWRFVNVKGGPDRRFNNNRQLPVMLYGEIDLSAAKGLHWLMMFSNAPLAQRLAQALSTAPATLKSAPAEAS